MTRNVLVFLVISVVLAGCAGLEQASGSPRPPGTAAAASPPASGTSAPSASASASSVRTPVSTPAPSAGATAVGTTQAAGTTYQDDRSGPDVLMQSYVNALNLKQYVRAYSYWENSAQLPPYSQFEQGFAGTTSVQLNVGAISSGVGAGQIYFSVPAALSSQLANGTSMTSVGCYVLHQSRPEIQSVPPFRGLAIQSAKVQPVPGTAPAGALLGQVCADTGGGPVYTPQTYDPADISATRYLDDRSDALQVLRSLFNAVNSKQYVRAYSYWQSPSVGSFSQFEQGYADTASVQLTTGAVSSDAGAGQQFYQVSVSVKVTTQGGAAQTFVGCYTLHVSRPEIQATPPFAPLGISAAKTQLVANDANTTALMSQACQP